MNRLVTFIVSVIALATFAGFGCGGGSSTNPPTPTPTEDKYSVIGTVTGLDTYGVTIESATDGSTYFINSDGTFVFENDLPDGSEYALVVKTESPEVVCSINNAEGTINGDNALLSIICAVKSEAYTIGGTVTGLTGSGLIIKNNGRDFTPIAADGSFTFEIPVPDSGEYVVRIQTQPSDQTCSVSRGLGVVDGANITNVVINCGTGPEPGEEHTVGGTVEGLTTDGLVLAIYGETLSIPSGDASFQFVRKVFSGSDYNVSVHTQPVGQYCTVTNGTGLIVHSDITDVEVTCANNVLEINASMPNDYLIQLSEIVSSPVSTVSGGIDTSSGSGYAATGTGVDLSAMTAGSSSSVVAPSQDEIVEKYAVRGTLALGYTYTPAGVNAVTSCEFSSEPFTDMTCTPDHGQIQNAAADYAAAMTAAAVTTAQLTVTADGNLSNELTINKFRIEQLSNINVDGNDYPLAVTSFAGGVYFEGYTPDEYNIYRIDEEAVTQVTDIPLYGLTMTPMGNNLYFTLAPESHIYSYDGNSTITKISQIPASYEGCNLLVYNNRLLFASGNNLYRYDGGEAIEKVTNMTNAEVACSLGQVLLTSHNGKVYLTANIVVDTFRYIKLLEYSEDGDGNPTIKQVSNTAGASASDDIALMKSLGTNLYFTAHDENGHDKLYKYDGSNVIQISNINDGADDKISSVEAYDGAIYFVANTQINEYNDTNILYKYDGTSITEIFGRNSFQEMNSLPTMQCGGYLYMFAGNSIAQYSSETGDVYVNFTPNMASDPTYNLSFLKCVGSDLYFKATSDGSNTKLFKLSH